MIYENATSIGKLGIYTDDEYSFETKLKIINDDFILSTTEKKNVGVVKSITYEVFTRCENDEFKLARKLEILKQLSNVSEIVFFICENNNKVSVIVMQEDDEVESLRGHNLKLFIPICNVSERVLEQLSYYCRYCRY